MLKNILNLEGAQQLSKNEQQTINGGGIYCRVQDYGKVCNGLGHICCGTGLCLPEGDPKCFD